MRRPLTLAVAVICAIGLIVLMIVGLSFSRPSMESDIIGVHYLGGPLSNKSFENCQDPSTAEWIGPGDNVSGYPISQRNIEFPSDSDKTKTITFVTKDKIEMSVQGVFYFRLNTSCKEIEVEGKNYPGGALQYFHELIGKRHSAYFTEEDGEYKTSSGWIKMMGIYLYKPLDTAIDRAGQGFTYDELYTDPAKKLEWETKVLELLPGLVDRQTDGEVSFFQDFALTLQKPEPPGAIKAALLAQQTAIAEGKAEVERIQAEERSAVAQAKRDENVAIAEKAVELAEKDKELAVANANIDIARANAHAKQKEIDSYGGVLNFIYATMASAGLNPFQPSYGQAIVNPQAQSTP